MLIAACVKWTDLRPEVDRVHGTVSTGGRDQGWSLSDRAAVEVALRLGEAWSAEVVVVAAGPADTDDGLRELLAAGVGRAVRVPVPDGADHASVATALAGVLLDPVADVVVCGDLSADRGSGAVPAYLAHHLDAAQALGLVEVRPGSDGTVEAVRRLDGGRREVLRVTAPAVLSVEGAVGELRRAPLAAVLASQGAIVDVAPTGGGAHVEEPRFRPWRPPPRRVPPPHGEHALERVVQLTGALVDRTPPRTVELDPPEAADVIIEQLRAWGYLA